MVRLLTGIGRFREMFYVIEALYNQHHFEVLCRKGKGDVKVRLHTNLNVLLVIKTLIVYSWSYQQRDVADFTRITLNRIQNGRSIVI